MSRQDKSSQGVPPENRHRGVAGRPSAESADPPPVWDAAGSRWSWVAASGAFVCDDPSYGGPPVATPGAIPEDRQPFYAHPPTDLELDALEVRSEIDPDP